jgi:hypothetical protein
MPAAVDPDPSEPTAGGPVALCALSAGKENCRMKTRPVLFMWPRQTPLRPAPTRSSTRSPRRSPSSADSCSSRVLQPRD